MIKLLAKMTRHLTRRRPASKNAQMLNHQTETLSPTPGLGAVTETSSRCTQLALVAGWFSYKGACATFGDTEAMHVVTRWLDEVNIPYHIACHKVNGTDGLDINTLDPTPYSMFIFVCGPWRDDSRKILEKFEHCYKIGIDLSLEDPVHLQHGFDIILARDMPQQHNPDLAFASHVPTLPLIGIAQVHPQVMYGNRQRHKQVAKAISEYLSRGEVAYVTLDTLHRDNPVKIGNVVHYENLVARLDAVITTRLHGLVFAIKRGIPAVAIDAIAGGAKVSAQANSINWPQVHKGDTVDADQISAAVEKCLDGSLDDTVTRSRENALKKLQQVKSDFLRILSERKFAKQPPDHA